MIMSRTPALLAGIDLDQVKAAVQDETFEITLITVRALLPGLGIRMGTNWSLGKSFHFRRSRNSLKAVPVAREN